MAFLGSQKQNRLHPGKRIPFQHVKFEKVQKQD